MKGIYWKRKFFNREISWIKFNERVLEEALDKNNPMLERTKFLAIVSSNLDEFFMVRVSSLFNQTLAGYNEPDISGFTPKEQIEMIMEYTRDMVAKQNFCYSQLIKKLKGENIHLMSIKELSEKQKAYIESFYHKNIYPVLTPMVVDRSRPFPLIMNKSLNIALILESKDENEDPIFGTIQVPSVIDRLVEIPSEDNKKCFMLLEDIIKNYLDELFTGHNIIYKACYRITRDTDQGLDEEEAEDLLEAIKQFLKKRKWGMAIRLEIEKGADKSLVERLLYELDLPKEFIYFIDGPIDLTYLFALNKLKEYYNLRYPAFIPQPVTELVEANNIFQAVTQGDVLLHHPFNNFDPVIEIIKAAAEDPNVLAIKQTLYRVSGNSPIVEALAQAAENGKQVTVLVELKARFDEQNNINWARRLEMSGCHVIYGLVGLKTHCKVLLVVRKEDDGIKRYVHMSTGNYNDATAKIYTDIGIFTSSEFFGEDASTLFNALSGYSRLNRLYKISAAPTGLREKFKNLIKQETVNAKAGRKGKIIAKINSLVDEQIINELYEASKAGVEIDLIVRGICCLRPGVKGMSEKISVKSIVGKYLEHSRIFYFFNDGSELLYLSSADWMGRNLDRRVEILFPVEDDRNFKKIKHMLDIYLKDNLKSRILKENGEYIRADKRGKENINCQTYFENEAAKEVQEALMAFKSNEFESMGN